MPTELKTKWLEALRSGKFKQGKGYLYNPATDSYCCLGVLEEVADGELKESLQEFSEEDILPASSSRGWYLRHGILDAYKTYDSTHNYAVGYLVSMNDGSSEPPKTFQEIADWIEENVEGYDSASVKQ